MAKGLAVYTLIGFLVSTAAGCSSATFKETLRGIAGNSTVILNDTRPQAITKEFAYSREECKPKIDEILRKNMETYVYAREGDLIAVFVSEKDTTPVGIFVSSEGPDKTKIEVSSPSLSAKEQISRKLFAALDEKLKTKKVNVKLDTVEEQK